MYNNTFLIGRLVRDPEYRLTSSGIAVCRFTIAVNKIKSDEADFLRIVAWRRLAEICSQYLKKGKLVAIEGRLQIESYVKDGVERELVEIIAENMQMLDRGVDSMSQHAEATLQES